MADLPKIFIIFAGLALRAKVKISYKTSENIYYMRKTYRIYQKYMFIFLRLLPSLLKWYLYNLAFRRRDVAIVTVYPRQQTGQSAMIFCKITKMDNAKRLTGSPVWGDLDVA